MALFDIKYRVEPQDEDPHEFVTTLDAEGGGDALEKAHRLFADAAMASSVLVEASDAQ